MLNLLVIHGPNLNLLGEREPDIYGSFTLDDVNEQISTLARQLDITVKIYQSNHEGNLIDFIHENRKWAHGIVINPGAFTHYSYALRDAIAGVQLPAVEVHISDINNREDFRKISVTRAVCIHQISGKGISGYLEGIHYIENYLKTL